MRAAGVADSEKLEKHETAPLRLEALHLQAKGTTRAHCARHGEGRKIFYRLWGKAPGDRYRRGSHDVGPCRGLSTGKARESSFLDLVARTAGNFVRKVMGGRSVCRRYNPFEKKLRRL